MAADSAKGAKKPAPDWEAIEREYRAGQLSVAEIGRQYSISHVAILKQARKKGWSRDLTEKVNAEIAARLVTEGLQDARGSVTIELAAERGVQLVREHRHQIGATFKAVASLIEELQSVTANRDEIEDDIIAETEGDKDGKRRARMLAAVALPSRAQVAGTLANALKTLIPLERQAFNIDNGSDKDDTQPGMAELTDKSIAKLTALLE